MGCGELDVDHGCAGCSHKPRKVLLGVGLVMCLLLLVLGTIKELDDGLVMRRSAAVLAVHHFTVAENMKLQVIVGEDAKKPNEVDKDHTSHYHAASPAAHDKDLVDINYMSKRRVPNGADPIHNRRAGKSLLPPSKT